MSDLSPAEIVSRCNLLMSHAWMVRTFVKHSEEAEDFPELMNLARTVFDISRALETRVDNPAAYFAMLKKKIGKLEAAARQFAIDAPEASAHTNFEQAVISMNGCVSQLREWLNESQAAMKVDS